MIKEYIGEAESLLDATENAKEGLISLAGLTSSQEDDIQIEVIAEFKKKTLGLFGGSLAKVRAYIELPDPAPKKEKKVSHKKAEDLSSSKETKGSAKASRPAKKEKAAPCEIAPSAQPEDLKDYAEFPSDSSVNRAATYIKSVLEHMGCENVTVKAADSENGIYLKLDGDKLGVVIGRRGETLDALQYLTSLSANGTGGYLKVTLNIGNYREKREVSLKALAAKVAAQVISSGRSRTLEPMNPYERRIIHTAVQDIDGVDSHSIGEGTGRRIVISPIGGDRRSGGSRGGRGSGRKPSEVVTAPTREPKTDSTSVPLYGRLN